MDEDGLNSPQVHERFGISRVAGLAMDLLRSGLKCLETAQHGSKQLHIWLPRALKCLKDSPQRLPSAHSEVSGGLKGALLFSSRLSHGSHWGSCVPRGSTPCRSVVNGRHPQQSHGRDRRLRGVERKKVVDTRLVMDIMDIAGHMSRVS